VLPLVSAIRQSWWMMPRDFPVRMAEVVGVKLRVIGIGPEPSAEERRELGRGFGMAAIGSGYVAHFSYEVVAPGGRVGLLDFGTRSRLASMTCADGAWYLQKRQRSGWELSIESAGGEDVGWYAGRNWLPGGTISVADGAPVLRRRALNGRWKLRMTNNRQVFTEMWRERSAAKMALTIRALPPDVCQASVVILTACAVLMLEWRTPSAPSASADA
jgi:hypothetical protein